MPDLGANGVQLHYEEQGEGAPILCIHGTGSSGLVWGDAVAELGRRGRVIAYDRRGCTRSERPEPYERTSVAEHADDAAALLEALEATPAIVIGRSYGGGVAVDLAARYPDRVRALVLLEAADLDLERAPGPAAWTRELAERLGEVAERDGLDAVSEAMLSEVLGAEGWASLPEGVRQMFTGNAPAILAEVRGEGLAIDEATLGRIEQPALVVAASDSPPLFRELSAALAETLPNARTALVEGGHLIDPADPRVLAFIEAVLEQG